jgi:hypothetical protein
MSGRGKTLKDLAAKLDISVATVSRALAGSERIAPAAPPPRGGGVPPPPPRLDRRNRDRHRACARRR